MAVKGDQERRAAHPRLDELLDRFESIKLADDLTGQIAGMATLADAAAFAGSLAGAETLIRIYGCQRMGSDRSKLLKLLARRLSVAAHLFRDIWNGDGHGLLDAASEADAVSMGDRPRLFARLTSKEVPARAALCRLRALEWDAYLEALGEPAKARRERIAKAFGASAWDTVRKWPSLVIQELGHQMYDLALADARSEAAIAKAGGIPTLAKWKLNSIWTDELENDGRRLLAELEARAQAS